jgi:hypothetical protein
MAVACVSTGYRGGDPFADPGPRAAPPGSRSVQVSLEGGCDVCSVTADLPGGRQRWVDTAVIGRRYPVAPNGGVVTMSAAPLPGRDPVDWIAIRIDGEIMAEARSDDPDAVTATPSSGALYISAPVPRD